MSWFPSSVKNLTAKPRTSRTVSAAPRSPAVVLNRQRTGVFFPTVFRNFAHVYLEMSLVTSNSPHAPEAFAWTTLRHISSIPSGHVKRFQTRRSGIRSRLKCAKVSRSTVSPSVVMLPPPNVGSVTLTEGSEIGWPGRVLERNVQDCINYRTFSRGKARFGHYKDDIIFKAPPFRIVVAIITVKFRVSRMGWEWEGFYYPKNYSALYILNANLSLRSPYPSATITVVNPLRAKRFPKRKYYSAVLSPKQFRKRFRASVTSARSLTA